MKRCSVIALCILTVSLFVTPLFAEEKLTIHKAAYYNKVDELKKLIDGGADVNAKDENGDTPLFSVLKNGKGQFKAAELLLQKGADISAKNKDGETLLIMASKYLETEEYVKLFLEKGADVNAKNASGMTAFLTATRGRLLNQMKILAEKGADVKGTAPNNLNAVLILAVNAINVDKTPDALKFLIEKGVDLKCVTSDLGETALMLTSKLPDNNLNEKMIELFLGSGADINAKNKKGANALMCAAAHGRRKHVKILIEKGADVNIKTTDGNTPLKAATAEKNVAGYKEVFEMLTAAGAKE